MKELLCEICSNTWYVQDQDLKLQQACPYCMSVIRGQIEFKEYDSLDKAIYGAILTLGIGVIENPRMLIGFMSDTAPNLEREIRIFSKTYSDRYIPRMKAAFGQPPEQAVQTIQSLHDLFIEEEGLSESWAEMLCKSIYGAVLFSQGIGITRFINVKISNYTSAAPAPQSPPPPPPPPKMIPVQTTEHTVPQSYPPKNSMQSSSQQGTVKKSLPEVGEVIKFGKLNNDPLKWIVLDVDIDKNVMLILALNELKKKRKYNDTLKSVTWERCTLRRYLNEEFFNNFTDGEKSIIAQTFLENKDNLKTSTQGGNNTVDRVFLLSIDEARQYNIEDYSRNVRNYWWLRSPGAMQDKASLVTSSGAVFDEGHYVSVAYGVRPAMYLKI